MLRRFTAVWRYAANGGSWKRKRSSLARCTVIRSRMPSIDPSSASLSSLGGSINHGELTKSFSNSETAKVTNKGEMTDNKGTIGKGPLQNFDDELNFPKMEEEVLELWERVDAFRESFKQSEGKKRYTFYDGPPFATGLPHYGHLLAGTIKDIVCRYAHQTGHCVERRFGWDCHGLPIEYEIDKKLGIKTSHDVMALGIDKYNDTCQSIVMRYSEEWRKTVTRMGRWIDFDNDYKTMYMSYMESVWWVFRQLWDKGLIYRGFKVMPFSTACSTPLSNFEANSNYKTVNDSSVLARFRTRDDPNTYFIAWTTTPWTLPSNLALCVHPDLDYVKVLESKTKRHYIVGEVRLSEVFPSKKKSGNANTEAPPYTIVSRMKGKDLIGTKYEPLFPYFKSVYGETAYRVIGDTYVETDSGTCVVHQAPGFGEDDFRICISNGIVNKEKVLCPVDENGRFHADVQDFAGRYVKDTDDDILKYLDAKGLLHSKGSVAHSYPFCWRSETPLIYKAVDSWFVNVESMHDRLLEANSKTEWVPNFVKTRRFSNWLEGAKDWNLSRNRYWGTPLPVWHSEDWEEVVCVGSVKELEELSGVTNIENIHRQFVDGITIPSKRPGMPPLRRVEEVFDCWFESGSMPYAQSHYPFENKEEFEQGGFPADFVAEGLDQTRGWFYTLLVLGVALFNTSPFKNVVVNGLILAEDGKKMSKRLKNYPEPSKVIHTHGADALRMYLINSPVVRAEPLCFRAQGVRGIVKDVLLPLFHATKFFIANANYCVLSGGNVSLDVVSTNEMDRWILASTQTLQRYVKKEMDVYHLYNVVPGVLRFVVDLSNWYVRMNRRRMKNTVDQEDRSQALSTMLTVLFSVSRIISPISPFVAEMLYQRIKPLLPASQHMDSVHYLMFPEEDKGKRDELLERAMKRMIVIVELARVLRDRMVISMKRPVRQAVIVHPDPAYLDDVRRVVQYIKDEVNAFDVVLSSGEEYIITQLDANMEALGKRHRSEAPRLRKAVQQMSHDEVASFLKNGRAEVCGVPLTLDDVKVVRKIRDGIVDFESNTDNDVVVLLDKREDQALVDSWRAREFVNRVQQLRKKAKLVVTDMVDVYFESEDLELTNSILNCAQQINMTIQGKWDTMNKMPAAAKLVAEEDNNISGVGIKIVFTEVLA
ncbi:isoleucine--tRNA ligase [Trypanosoma rangeli]|uniref:isoleucine--tRNA ligase n=1 Tax=Trypanosoma rangeli TaxID=5698 RepID=A0A422NSC8_TRYRA|nr:isoleucine--tRNA ligase [Trypanosoma rangeli]RNF08377.1 isoleucine--tRNA ligase [Trypanosoma rangeli]|eukprot:RNF08377.1 isoleucine--tRNA ligase [Trypanosoma rangeli]